MESGGAEFSAPEISVPEIADRVLLESNGWFVAVVSKENAEAVLSELSDELDFLLEEEGRGRRCIVDMTSRTLVDDLRRLKPDDVAVLVGVERATLEDLRGLDLVRNRFVGGPAVTIVTTEGGLQTLASAAPNLWSWIGPRIWQAEMDVGRLDVPARLESLRQGTGLNDAEFLRRAGSGELPADPVYAEWLALLDQGDQFEH